MANLFDRRCRSKWGLVLGVALSVLGATVPLQAFADNFQSGNNIFADCNSNDWGTKGFCMGYIVGIADVLYAGNAINGYRACIPKGATQGQVQDVVVQWLRANPQDRHYAASGTVAQALGIAFPCKR